MSWYPSCDIQPDFHFEHILSLITVLAKLNQCYQNNTCFFPFLFHFCFFFFFFFIFFLLVRPQQEATANYDPDCGRQKKTYPFTSIELEILTIGHIQHLQPSRNIVNQKDPTKKRKSGNLTGGRLGMSSKPNLVSQSRETQVFSSPGQRPCELLPSLGVRRPFVRRTS